MEQVKGYENCNHTIELDCAPGGIRPNDLITGVLDGTGITLDDIRNTSRFFGNWVFEIDPIKNDIYEANVDKVQERVIALYNSESIRYGSW